MNMYGCNCFVLWLFFVSDFIPENKGHEEIVEGLVTAEFVNKNIPSLVYLNITLGGKGVNLTFVPDPDANPDCPVFVLSTDESGQFRTEKASLPKPKDFAVYHDLEKNAALRVSRERVGSATRELHLEGIVHTDGKMYELKSTEGQSAHRVRSRRGVTKGVSHKRQREYHQEEEFKVQIIDAKSGNKFDYLRTPQEPQRSVKMRHSKFPKKVKFTHKKTLYMSGDVNIDIVAVADYAVFKDWYQRESSLEAALTSIKQYYAFVFSGVNMLYKSIKSMNYTIHVRLSSIIVSTTANSAGWTELIQVISEGRKQVDAYRALIRFALWAATSNVLPKYDLLMLFTGYDLTTDDDGVVSADTVGLSYTGKLCNTLGTATAVIEDLGGFQCIHTAAHELGHSLSAEHDGDNNTCRAEDQYIMTAVSTYINDTKLMLDPWIFSPCSTSYFSTFITGLAQTTRGQQCLFNVLPTSPDIPDVSTMMPGQIYDANEQCRQIYGQDSYHCLIFRSGKPSDICTTMFCAKPLYDVCSRSVAARGTTCGNRKWCVSGQCIYDSRAPPADDNCVFGDRAGPIYKGLPCFMLNLDSELCAFEIVRKVCCRSCAPFYRPDNTFNDPPTKTEHPFIDRLIANLSTLYSTTTVQTAPTTPLLSTISTQMQGRVFEAHEPAKMSSSERLGCSAGVFLCISIIMFGMFMTSHCF